MVGEFPELQGSIGGYLLRNKNYDEIVYKAAKSTTIQNMPTMNCLPPLLLKF